MSDTDKTATLSEIKAMRERGELTPTAADAPEKEMPDGFWDTATPNPQETPNAK